MKALDTGVLLGLLEGSTKVRDQVRRLRGVELATTEANLLELAYLAGAGSPTARRGRLAALEKLRQRLTVLPLDARAVQRSTEQVARLGERISPTAALMLGALQAAGCEELLTDDPRSITGDWGLRVRSLSI